MPDGGGEESERAQARKAARKIVRDDKPVLPNRSSEDTDEAWGELPRERDDWYERERPPHHGT